MPNDRECLLVTEKLRLTENSFQQAASLVSRQCLAYGCGRVGPTLVGLFKQSG
jgi:hypothetical protein